MVSKIYRSILLIMLLWLLGGTRPVRARQKKDDQFQFSDSNLRSGKRQCFHHVNKNSSEHLSELVFASSYVFEAIVISKSQPDLNAIYGVNLRVKKSFKGDLKRGKNLDYVRISFLYPGTTTTTAPVTKSKTINTSTTTTSCAIPAVLEPGKKYIVFAREIRNRQFVPLSAPVPRTKVLIEELKKVICHKCEPTIGRMSDSDVIEGTNFQLRCVVRPGPHARTSGVRRVTSFAWYKNARLVRNSRRRKIKNKHFSDEKKPKDRSILRISNAKTSDAGLYLCRAKLDGHLVETEARVTVQKQSRQVQTPEDGKIMEGLECPISSYCLNGGSCLYYASLGELTCICASGYRGKRCEQKDVYENGMIWGHRVSRCVLGITHFPC